MSEKRTHVEHWRQAPLIESIGITRTGAFAGRKLSMAGGLMTWLPLFNFSRMIASVDFRRFSVRKVTNMPSRYLAALIVAATIFGSIGFAHAQACGIRGKAASDSDGRRPPNPI